jgi:hypothetical protein
MENALTESGSGKKLLRIRREGRAKMERMRKKS